MQACIPAKDDPFHTSHQHTPPLTHNGKSSDTAKHASGLSLHPDLLETAKDTFTNSSVLLNDEEVFHEPRKEPPLNPGPGAQRIELLEYIKQQLDCYGKEPLLMNRYQLLGPDQRASGGALSH
jgi:hypothetical protein